MYYTNIIYIRFFFIDGEKKIIKKLCRRKNIFLVRVRVVQKEHKQNQLQ